MYVYTVSEIVGLALKFATHNCLGCYSKFNFGGKFHGEVASHHPQINLKHCIPYIIIIAI